MCVSLHARKDVQASRKESFAEASWKLHLHIYIFIYTQKHTDILHTNKIDIDIDIDPPQIQVNAFKLSHFFLEPVVQGFLPHAPSQQC